jgi:broad specificity phosphatase PhoE
MRPLSDRGREQALGLVRLLGDRHAIDAVASSPSVRCIETVSSLAAMLTLDIRVATELGEGEGPEGALALARTAAGPDRALVLCSHGDVIPAVLEVLEIEGLDLGRHPQCQKGSTWVLEGEHGRFHTSTYLAPPS